MVTGSKKQDSDMELAVSQIFLHSGNVILKIRKSIALAAGSQIMVALISSQRIMFYSDTNWKLL
jgi:hypothetical protein